MTAMLPRPFRAFLPSSLRQPMAKSVLAALSCLATLAAQSAVSITDANASFSYTGYPTSTTSTVGYCNFAAAAVDHAYQSWWYYAVQGDTRGSALNTAGGQMTATVASDNRSVALDWANVDSRNFAAKLVNRVYSTGAASGISAQALTITNNTGAPLTINLYCYTDLDVAGASNDSAAQATGWPTGSHMVQDTTGVQCWVMASGFANFDVTAFATARGNVLAGVGGAPYVPANTGLPFGPGDYTSVYHWVVTIAPGASSTQSSLLAITQIPASQRIASATTYCAGKPGTNGVPTWTVDPPFIGAGATLRIENGFPGVAPILFVGASPTSLPIAPYGTVCTVPVNTLAMPVFDGARISSLPVSIPNQASLGAAPVYWQALFLDPGAVASLAHTGGLTWRLGSFSN